MFFFMLNQKSCDTLVFTLNCNTFCYFPPRQAFCQLVQDIEIWIFYFKKTKNLLYFSLFEKKKQKKKKKVFIGLLFYLQEQCHQCQSLAKSKINNSNVSALTIIQCYIHKYMIMHIKHVTHLKLPHEILLMMR